MGMYESFDDFSDSERMVEKTEQAPFQFREDKSDEGTLIWLNNNFDSMEIASESRMRTYRRYLAMYKGLHWNSGDTRDTLRDEEYTDRNPKHSVNFVYEFTEAKVAQNARMKSHVAAIPNNDEQPDYNNAKLCKLLIDAKRYELQIDDIFQKNDRVSFNMGHSFIYIPWDPECGEVAPSYKALEKKYGKGKVPKPSGSGKLAPVKVGDVKVKVVGPDKVFPELFKQSWDELDHLDYIEWDYIEKVKADYPKKAKDIQENSRKMFDYNTSELGYPKDQVMVRYFFHKPTKYLPEGILIKYTDDVILEKGPFPYEDGELPFVPQTDIDVYGELWGRSYISNIEQMQRMYNNIQSGIARDFSIGSAPKWMMPKGACDIHSLNNDFTIVEYTGPVAPQIVTPSATSARNFEFQDLLEKKMSSLSTVYDISRGEVPSGVTANSALRFLDEQESQRIIVQEQKRKRTVLAVYRMMLSRMKQYYTAADGRTVRILGQNNEYLIKSMQKADFTKIYDVELQNTSALPDTKAGKISAIIDLNMATQTDPIFKKAEVIEMLELGTSDYFQDKSTISVNAARTNLQRILDSEEYVEPKPYEDLLVHYSIFDKALQEDTFKNKTDLKVKENLAKYVLVLEGLMYDRATKNQKFLLQMMELDNYPMFFQPEAPLQMLMGNFQPPQMAEEGLDLEGKENLGQNDPQQTEQGA
jgi:hypothetical protein